MMKKILLLSAAFLALQAIPALAADATTAPDAKERPHGGPGGRMDKMFEMQDTNKDGAITEDESAAAAKKRFEKSDANKDGKLTKDEIKAEHDAMKKKWEEKRKEMGGAKPVPAPAE